MAPLLSGYEAAGDVNQPSRVNSNTPARRNVLYIDAYDSFSFNVVAMLEEILDVKVTVMTIDSDWPDGNMVDYLQHFEAVVLGPGPGNPNISKDVGIMQDIWNLDDADLLPVLGICLGFQSLCLRHGISIGRLPYPLHGQVHRITTAKKDIFEGMRDVEVTLYHSLYAKVDLPELSTQRVEDRQTQHENYFASRSLDLLAWFSLEEGNTQIPMAVRHKRKPFWGVQFHPESCKSDREACTQVLKRWWDMSLNYNRKTGRGGYGALPDYIISSRSGDENSLPDAAFTMLNWSASASSRSAYRTLTAKTLDAESICEHLNAPDSPTVLFQSNGRYSIISVPTPVSWRLEYSAETQKLLLEKLQDCYSPDSAFTNSAATENITERSLSVPQFWDVMRFVMDMKKVDSGSLTVPFWGGFLGYFSYEMGLACLARPKSAAEIHPASNNFGEDPADASLLWVERSVVVDNKTGQITVQSTRADDDLSNKWLDQTAQSLQDLAIRQTLVQLSTLDADTEFLDSILTQSITQFPTEEAYQNQIRACQAELEAGESYELCLTCETSIKLPSPATHSGRVNFPWKLYKRLRKYNPAAFSGFARLGHVKIVSSSPECFLNWDRSSTLEMKPMKGTVRKSADMTLEKAKEILSSTKEMAENLMIADLIRHDLYGICGSAGVRVEKLLEVEDHGRVYQMITHVKAQVDRNRPGFAVRDMPQLRSSNMSGYGLTALQRCLPPGSMTGAPKERSCMHLSSIENRKRGVYSGVMGYLDLGGGGSFSVLIRTAFTCSQDQEDEQLWRIGAGGAVTTLSTPEGEWDEMLTKLRTVCGIFAPSK
ncbi:aminodeoxychorismate synthase pabA [Aspergillus clavatus NRRL 1]|uniref:aminodeoxychorismate synthase n=1 Tax=Aspergillus clavatus (strain ATCC 1007 / CBS 513.65 / DSM 816 / NCTC 3887 / NRRL 1 / QM 1276 / 107) TaxID=344612 RepID=A1CM52_ASPCL|nr:para-aminobenzoate synthase PabaA [Aspergillus clavatus NRRL 1]EAW08639.1 para-aminobenzoate synthase PabaA [Aspergillus clavatus NRRL 1]